MAGDIVSLDRASLATHVQGPGVAVILWREGGNLPSYALDRTIARAAQAYPEIRFGALDVGNDERLAQDWAVDELPTLMIYRDGTFLFAGSGGELSAEAIDTLLGSALSMDLGMARQGVNGHQGRFVLGFQTGQQPPRGPWNDAGEGAGPLPDGNGAK